MVLGMVWRLIRRFPVTATSIVCGLVASISGIWLLRRQISPAPQIPGSVDLIPDSGDLIPGSAEKLPGYLLTGIRRQAFVLHIFFVQY
jgi:di/tricarboxylate transporter